MIRDFLVLERDAHPFSTKLSPRSLGCVWIEGSGGKLTEGFDFHF